MLITHGWWQHGAHYVTKSKLIIDWRHISFTNIVYINMLYLGGASYCCAIALANIAYFNI